MILRLVTAHTCVFLLKKRNFATKLLFSEYLKFIDNGKLLQFRKVLDEVIEIESKNTSVLNNSNMNIPIDAIKCYRNMNQIYQILNNQNLFKLLILSNNFGIKLRYPIPPKYLKIYERSGFRVAKFTSSTLYFLGEFFQLLKQNLKMTMSISFIERKISIPKRSVLIFGLNREALIQKSSDEMCFENWIKLNFNESDYFIAVGLTLKDRTIGFIKGLNEKSLFEYSLKNIVKYYFRALINSHSMSSKVLILRYADEIFRFWFLNRKVSENTKSLIWLSSRTWVRPLWNKKMSCQSVKSLFINLSDTEFPRTVGDHTRVQIELLNLWDSVYVTSKSQFERYTKSNEVSIKGVPYWTDNKEAFDLSHLRQKYCAIFDIQPSRKYLGWGSINDCGFVDYEASLKFIVDIVEICQELDIKCIHKPKRKNPKNIDREYISELDKIIAQYSNYIYVEADTSPHRIIASSAFTVSMPFTSTGSIANSLEIPNIYYDPIGKVALENTPMNHINLVNSRKNLNLVLTNFFA